MACIPPIFTSCKRSPKRKRQQTPQPLRPPLAENQDETLPANLLDPGDHRRWRSLRRLYQKQLPRQTNTHP
ncbi:hypothetical protein RRG08_023593 [Elysia crispata]|uniref:Uncharacterized protein n=1 Tax=Elysia crispata TaxID=231223 RepID=A0AAE0YPT9_9GAST|nr:hypothetical protein RRG08_023593 [Elysia crispata]